MGAVSPLPRSDRSEGVSEFSICPEHDAHPNNAKPCEFEFCVINIIAAEAGWLCYVTISTSRFMWAIVVVVVVVVLPFAINDIPPEKER